MTRAPGRPADPDLLTGEAPLVVLAPHPDDESLGCGALLAHAFAGGGAHVICMTDGAASHRGSADWPAARLAKARRRELFAAVGRLGGGPRDVTWLGHADGWLGAGDRQAIAAVVAAICQGLGARRLFAPAVEDRHEDHRATADIALRALALTPGLMLFSYPVWSRWDDPAFAATIAGRDPLTFASASYRTAKRAAIEAHATQLGHLIKDDPSGFALPPGFVDAFVEADEIFWRTRRCA